MDVRVKSLKIINSVIENKEEIESSILNIKGVVDAKINELGSDFKLDYALDNWASDYDVMVSIMELLENDYSLESEPYFDEDEDIVIESKEDNEYYYEDHVEEDEEEYEHEEHGCSCHNHSHHHAHGEFVNTPKSKLIELGVSLGIFIIGLILSFVDKTKQIAPYIMVVAYSVAGYETLFEGLIGLFRKDFFNEKC